MGAKNLLSALVGPHEGKPMLVICGGPSMSEALELIPADYPACVISANGHGFKQDKFKVDYLTHVDVVFSKTQVPSAQHFAQYGVPTISRWSFADYRIPNCNFAGDTGMTAVWIASLLGGHPIVVAGLDRNRGPRRYFWESTAEVGWGRRRLPPLSPNLNVNANNMINFVRGSQVRVMPSMRDMWPWRVWSPDEVLPPFVPHPDHRRVDAGQKYTVLKKFFLHPSDPVNGGTVVLSDNEAVQHLRTKSIR
jgi:hypothetical protein